LKTGGAVSTKMADAGPVALSCKPSMCPVTVPGPLRPIKEKLKLLHAEATLPLASMPVR
jgi:hypothetical protein